MYNGWVGIKYIKKTPKTAVKCKIGKLEMQPREANKNSNEGSQLPEDHPYTQRNINWSVSSKIVDIFLYYLISTVLDTVFKKRKRATIISI